VSVAMTNRDLLEALQVLTDGQLDMLVVCLLSESGGPCPIADIKQFKDVLDERRPKLEEIIVPEQPVLMVVQMRYGNMPWD
jgi:hypothetical protein